MIPEEMILVQLGMMIFNDQIPHLDLAYLVTETSDNDRSGIETAARISRENLFATANGVSSTKIGIGGFSHPACDSPANIRNKLFCLGMRMEDIVNVNYPDAPVGPNGFHHTGTEMAMVARYAVDNDYDQIGLIAPPFHQLRSYLHLLTSLHRAGCSGQAVKVFNCTGSPQSWTQKVCHSQGTVKASRSALLYREIENCLKYWRQGYLISPMEALGYFLFHRS